MLNQGDRQIFLGYLAPKTADTENIVGIIDRVVDVQNRDWYNESRREPASHEEISRIKIPQGLKANHREFRFLFNLPTHKLVVDNSDRKALLSPKQAERLFKLLSDDLLIREIFGVVNITVEKNRSLVAEIFDNPVLKYLSIRIKKDNGDQPSSELVASIEKQMESSQAQDSEFNLTPPRGQSLMRTPEVEALANHAASNGNVVARVVKQGKTKTISLEDYPAEESESYNPKTDSKDLAFERATERILRRFKKKSLDES